MNTNNYEVITQTSSCTALEILNDSNVSFEDRLWLVLRNRFLSEKSLRMFAIWCYKQTINFTDNIDVRSSSAVEQAELFAEGKITKEGLQLARLTAWAVLWTSADSKEENPSWSARAAAWSTVESASSAAEMAAEAAAKAAGIYRPAIEQEQLSQLKAILMGSEPIGDTK